MTANELANLIENEDTLWLEPHLDAIATMLRQQQAEIEALKKELALQKLSDIGQEIERELTDEEIVNILDEICGNDKYIEVLNMIIFARAILKKASKK